MGTGYPETMRQLLGTIQREAAESKPPWDGFAAIAWFAAETGRAIAATFCYRRDDPQGRLLGSAATAALFERLRDIVAVTSGPVGALVVTQIVASGAVAVQVLAPDDPQLRSTLAPGTPPQPLGAALRPADLPLTGAPARGLSVQRPDPDDPTGAVPDDLLPRLSAADARRLADYLDAGAVLARTTFRVADQWSGSTRPEVPVTKRTDGTWHWDDVVAHYVRTYGLNPDPAFLAHARARDFQAPAVPAERVTEVIDQLFSRTATPGPPWQLRLDGSQVLPTGVYCSYRDQVLFYGGGDDTRVRLRVPPGAPVPAGFDALDDRAADRPAIAHATVPASEVSGYRLAVSGCRYKGAKATIVTIRGKHWLIKIDANAPSRDGHPAPTLDDWAIAPNVRVTSPEEIFTWIEAGEASQVYTLLIRCHPIGERIVPMWQILGPSTNPDDPDERLYCHPAADDSPFLPPGPAMEVLAGRVDPGYPLREPELMRLRHGWCLKVAASVADTFYIDDDAVVYTCPAHVPPGKVSEMLTAELIARHPIVDPPGGGWEF